MHGSTLSWGLHWVRRVQTRLVERACADVGEEYQNDQKKRGEISPRELRHSGTCNPIIMDISSTRHLVHGRRVCRSGDDDLINLFASYFIQKDENPLPRHRISKYNAGQEILTGTPESSDVITGEVLKLLRRGRGFSYFRRKDEAKRFRESSSPLLRTSLLCPR